MYLILYIEQHFSLTTWWKPPMRESDTFPDVLRMDGDGPCNSNSHKVNGGTGGDYRYYASSISTNHGHSWSSPQPIDGAGCARPRLLSMGVGGPLLMSGGRLCESTQGHSFASQAEAEAYCLGAGLQWRR